EVPGVGGHAPRRVPRRLLSDIVEPRSEEIFHEVRRRLEETGFLESIHAGAVLTGGANLMEGMVECAEEVLGMPVRMGFPVGLRGLVQLVQGPQYAASVGLVRYGAKQLHDARERENSDADEIESPEPAPVLMGKGLMGWLKGAF